MAPYPAFANKEEIFLEVHTKFGATTSNRCSVIRYLFRFWWFFKVIYLAPNASPLVRPGYDDKYRSWSYHSIEWQKANHIKGVSFRYFVPTSVIGQLIFLWSVPTMSSMFHFRVLQMHETDLVWVAFRQIPPIGERSHITFPYACYKCYRL